MSLDAMSENKIKWTLFAAFSLSFPLVFAAPVVGVFYIPLFLILITNIEWVFSLNFNPLTAIVIVQLLGYGTVVYLVSKYTARALDKLQKLYLNIAMTSLLMVIIWISFFRIYGFEGGENLYATYHSVLRI